MSLVNVLIGLLMFLFLITIHEAGHFIVGKISGIKVNEFSIGMGPALFKKNKGETLYSLRLLPIGGYVRFDGEDEDSKDLRSFNNSAPWKRFLTILAGPLINLFAGFLIILIITFNTGFSSNVVKEVNKEFPAYTAGIKPNDRIVAINNQKVKIFREINQEIEESKSDKIKVTVIRNNKSIDIFTSLKKVENRKLIGITPEIKNNFLDNIKYSWNVTIFFMGMIFKSLIGLFNGSVGLNSLSGPVGVINIVGTSINMGVVIFLNLTAIISINLGLFNLLPIPALDGSKLVFTIYEMIFRRPINKKFEQIITIAGFFILIVLMFIISIKDVISLF